MDIERMSQIITFYSYKGGTGRSMALANLACIASKFGRRTGKVLVIDWDLEAPGLAAYFFDQPAYGYSYSYGNEFDYVRNPWRPGILDLFSRYSDYILQGGVSSEDDCRALVRAIGFNDYIAELDLKDIYYMGPGKSDDKYEQRLSEMRWDSLYDKAPSIFNALADLLTSEFDFVLIDSRTGFNDISSVCTMLMPEKLVVVFTPNRQSLSGIASLVSRATKIRRQSNDMRPLAIFPLPSRVDINEPKLRDQWRFGRLELGTVGYQRLFERLFREEYGLNRCDLSEYFDDVQIQYSPAYSYGEDIAVLDERDDRLSLARSYESFGRRLFGLSAPWESFRSAAADKSLDSAHRAVEMDPAFAGAYLHRASVYEKLGRHEDAIEDLSRAIQRDPKSAHTFYRRGMVLLRMQDFDRSIADFESALVIDPEHSGSLAALSSALSKVGNLDRALEVIDRALLSSPRDTSLLLERAALCLRLGLLSEAMDGASYALQLDPSIAYGYVLRGLVAIYTKRFELALDEFSRASQLDPVNVIALYLRAVALQDLGRHVEALEDFRHAIDLDGQFYPAMLASADVLAELGHYEESSLMQRRAEMVSEVLPLDNEHVDTLSSLGFTTAS
jgi:tetratricopeptide (TPR) repeat protein